jgi:mutator protein MutT
VRVRPQVQALSRRFAASERLSPDSLSSDSLSQAVARPVIHVVAAALMDATDRVLIAQRPEGKHLAGGWEFPGGKLEPGEERLAGLARELSEELGITITASPRPLIRVRHSYPSRDVLLDMWVVKHYDGEPQGLDGQALRWCTQEELASADLLPADKPIVKALRLPERLRRISTPYYSVGDLSSLGRPIVVAGADDAVELRGVFCASAAAGSAAACAGAEFLVLSEVLLPSELAGLCHSLPVPVFASGIELEQAWALGASGLNEIRR